jgi:ribosomal protein S18 acetylase RimI-like enzyme
MPELVEYLTYTHTDEPSEEVKSCIVQMSNMLDDEMAEYCKLSYGFENVPKPIDHTVEGFKSDFFSVSDSAVMLLVVDSSPVGYCWWHATDMYATIHNFYVLNSERRRGYGAALMKAVLSRIENMHPHNPSVGLDTIPRNIPAQEFYSKLGFMVDCISYRYNFRRAAEAESTAITIDLESAPMIVLNELYLASIQPSTPMVLIRGPDAGKLFNAVWDLAKETDVFSKHLVVTGPYVLKIRDSWLIATDDADQEGVDLFRGRNFSSVFSLPGAKDAPKSMELSLLTSKRVGLGRVYNVVPELNL